MEVVVIKTLTIRNLPAGLAEALEREKRRRGKSLNETVIELLGQGLAAQGVRSNGLGRMATGWGEDEFREFERATAQFEAVDEELWR
jgi:plasmid stability protein